jgi:RNA polymerase sigma-70 factor (ECF subfamily)
VGGDVAIEELEALRVPLTGYCYRLLGSAADTDDAVQEALIRAASSRNQYDQSRGRLSTWVHGIATNVCIDMLRAAKRRALVVDLSQPQGTEKGLGTPLPPDRCLEPMPAAGRRTEAATSAHYLTSSQDTPADRPRAGQPASG